MVYCARCGTLNADDAAICKNCGAPLQTAQAQGTQSQAESKPYNRQWRWEDWEERREYHRRNGAFAALAIGLIIVLIGVLIIIAGLRSRRYWNRQ